MVKVRIEQAFDEAAYNQNVWANGWYNGRPRTVRNECMARLRTCILAKSEEFKHQMWR